MKKHFSGDILFNRLGNSCKNQINLTLSQVDELLGQIVNRSYVMREAWVLAAKLANYGGKQAVDLRFIAADLISPAVGLIRNSIFLIPWRISSNTAKLQPSNARP